jgi:hypothetical protein
VTGSTISEALLRSLHAPRRNRYYAGKLLDADSLQVEQCYGIEKRWLLNRLALGPGVLCGLTVRPGADGTVCIDPGVAIDHLGREIVVPAAVPIDPAQPLDLNGFPSGDRLVGGQSTIYLCYTECGAEPSRLDVGNCDGTVSAAMSKSVERYRLVVQSGVPAAKPPSLTQAQRDTIFPGTPTADFDRRVAAQESLASTCSEPPDMACLVLATVTLPTAEAGLAVDQYAFRAEVFSNTVLFELIVALAERVDACCGDPHQPPPPDLQAITITSGDGQSGEVSQLLTEPVVLLVADSSGNAVAGAPVEVTTTDAGAELSVDLGASFAPTLAATSAADGTVSVQWRVGSTAGPQAFTGTLTSNGSSATAHATATPTEEPPPPVEVPPVVVEIVPDNGAVAQPSWAEDPGLVVTFDQDMDPDGLAAPETWLRAWWFHDFGNGQFSEATRIRFTAGDPPDGNRIAFRAEPLHAEKYTVVVLMRGSDPEIVARDTRLALDAEFPGTQLEGEQLDRLWDQADTFLPDQDFVDRVRTSGAALPSGDGVPGGTYFHSLFTVN